MTTERETREQRIAREEREMGIRPWEFAPSAVSCRYNPWEDSRTSGGYTTWKVAQEQRREIFQRDPGYFWDDDHDLLPPRKRKTK